MKWLKSCLEFFQKKKVAPEPAKYTLETYKSAGTIFTDDMYILAGYQPNKKIPFISGIGGMKHKGETYLHTAIRETIEELLEIHTFPYKLMYDIISRIKPKNVVINTTYVIIIFTFDDLIHILQLVKKYELISPIYSTIPTNLIELLFERKSYKKSEISHLILLPAVKNLCFDHNFINDLHIIY